MPVRLRRPPTAAMRQSTATTSQLPGLVLRHGAAIRSRGSTIVGLRYAPLARLAWFAATRVHAYKPSAVAENLPESNHCHLGHQDVLLYFLPAMPSNDSDWDFLSRPEADASELAMQELASVTWAQPLLNIIRSRGGITRANMTFLFELRFALALHRAGIATDYEIQGARGTIDFGFTSGGRAWRVELMRLLETNAAREAAWRRSTDDRFAVFGRMLNTDAPDPLQSEEGETIKAIERICQKFERDGQAYKFPPLDGALHVLLIDFRTFLLGGDSQDWIHVGLGADFVAHDALRRYWRDRPITGVFDPRTKLRGATFARERVHFLGFVNERTFTCNELPSAIEFVANPRLFQEPDEARAALACWPIQPAVQIAVSKTGGAGPSAHKPST